jgi:DNA-binding transcriptional regulator LsrR (DeoR family)
MTFEAVDGGRKTPDAEAVRASSSTSDGAMVLTAAYLYYVDEQSQEAISQRLSVSRSTVSRLLSEARRSGIVRIEVVAPPPIAGLDAELCDRLGLESVYLAPGIAPLDDPGGVLARATGQALRDSDLREGDAVLVSWGRAMWSVSLSDLPALPGVVVVPALGGLNDEQPWVQTNEIARQLAARLHGTVLLLHAPAVPSIALRRSLLSDESVSAALSRWDDAPVALFGIGAWNQAEPLPPKILAMDSDTLARSAGDVAARLFDAQGQPVHYETESRLLGIDREQLARVRRRIGIAVGIRKTAAIVAAARSGLVNVLVTDVVTASALIASLDRGAPVPSVAEGSPGPSPG